MQGKHSELEGMQSKIAQLITEEMKTREDAENKLRRQIQEKAILVQQEIVREA